MVLVLLSMWEGAFDSLETSIIRYLISGIHIIFSINLLRLPQISNIEDLSFSRDDCIQGGFDETVISNFSNSQLLLTASKICNMNII